MTKDIPNIEIVVFDDSVINSPNVVSSSLAFPRRVLINGIEHSIVWHSKWHALGDVGVKNGEQINLQERFDSALEWCCSFNKKAIIFFDYELKPDMIAVTVDHIRKVGASAIELTGKANEESASESLNQAAQGLLLAVALATNPNADVDVWLASGVPAGISVTGHVSTLRKSCINTNRVVENAGNALTKMTPENVVTTINHAIETFIKTRTHSEGLRANFWPDSGKEWFQTDPDPSLRCAPHNHSFYNDLPTDATDRDPLVKYLISLGADANTARVWLAQ